jgi:hypothetical protein
LIGVVIAFIVGIADLYFVVRFLLETEGIIKRPTLDDTDVYDAKSKDVNDVSKGSKSKDDSKAETKPKID